MKTLYIFVEKMQMLDNILTQLSNDKYKDFENKLLSYDEIQVFNLFGFGLYKYKIPSNIKYKNYPIIKEKEYKRVTHIGDLKLKEYIPPNFKEKLYIKYKINYVKLSNYQELLNSKNKVDFLIYVDCDTTGVNVIDRLLNDYWPKWKNEVNNVYINLFINPESIFNVFKNRNHFIKYNELKKMGNIKYFFDYNYMINSMIFFKEILNYTNNKEDIYISKNTILTLHLMWNEYYNKSFSFNDLLIKMNNKFKFKSHYIGNIGTPSSTYYILQNIFKLNIFDKIDEQTYSFNKNAITFISFFHKKTFDPFIIERLKNWQKLDENEAKQKITKYLIEVFKSQKRKNNYLK